ncbi:Ku protein [Streptomyces axinellae]|uniref:Non-homologous end joining protein Ku n=1 Tax=Streptomyces axinellae TaxID=552788 RepID=A0ABP6C9D3_9ACTN
MARPVWSGVITFGLVTVPVRMYAATEDHTTRFHQLQRGTNDRVRVKRVNERTGKNVDRDDIVKGYEIGEGEYITVEPAELNEIAPGKSQVIDVSGFVATDEVDPVYFVRPYYLSPSGEQYAKPYELLRAALADSGKTGIATFVMHSREYLVALRAADAVLTLHTLHWSDEVRDPNEELPALPGRQRSRGKELKTAEQLIDSMSTTWRPEEYTDTYEDRVRALVEAKANGEEVTPEEGPPEATNVVDLSEALNRSIERARSGGSRSRERAAPLKDLGKDELYRRAAGLGVRGRSSMTRDQLLDAVEKGGSKGTSRNKSMSQSKSASPSKRASQGTSKRASQGKGKSAGAATGKSTGRSASKRGSKRAGTRRAA